MVNLLFGLLSVLLIACGTVSSSLYLLTLGMFSLYATNLIFAWKKRHSRGVVFLFLISFFTFLLGRILIYSISGIPWWYDITEEEAYIVIIGICLALFTFFIGVLAGEKFRIFTNKSFFQEQRAVITTKVLATRRVALILFWLTFAANAYEVINRIFFVLTYSYVEAYLSYGGVNIIVSRLADINKLAFFLFLATIPPKREAKGLIIIWLILNILTILAGGRTTAVIAILVVLYYCIYRDNHLQHHETPWLSAKMKRVMIISAPVAIAFLAAWNYIRNSSNINLGFFEMFLDFFESQGGAYKHLAFAYRYAGELPQEFYTFGPIINFLRGNIIVSSLTGFKMPLQNTIEMATTGYLYGQAITYIHQPWNYLAGLGMGSSYLAELYYDFGFFGIAIFNILLGVMFSKLSKISPNRMMEIFFMLIILDSTLNLPRNTCMAWFTSLTSITLWATILFVYILTFRKT